MRLIRRVVHWWRFRSNEADVAEELEVHRRAIEEDLIAHGHAPQAASAAARRAMGNELMMREESRAVWLWPWLEGVWQDARTTLRGLRRSPAFSAGVMLTFALGVGANAAMFAFLDRELFQKPAMMRDPSTVNRVYLYRTREGRETEASGRYARHADLERWTTSFSDIAGFSDMNFTIGTGANARDRRVGVVSASFFDFFSAPPPLGRYFTAAEDVPPVGAPVAVLSYRTWQTEYGGRREAIGSQLQIDAVRYTIIGVAPKQFVGLWPLNPPFAYIPIATYAASAKGSDWATTYGWAFGMMTLVRRKPGVSVETASADLTNALMKSYRAEGDARGPSPDAGDRIARLRPRALAGPILLERSSERSNVVRVGTWLGGVTLIVLLIACANVASLLLARGLARRREIALRLALGVSQMRLLSQLMTESFLLAVSGSMLGIVVAHGLNTVLTTSFLPGAEPARIADTRTMAFIAITAVAVAVFTSAFPIMQAQRLSIADDLRSGVRSGTYRRSHARTALLVLQAALSVVLLTGAGLFVGSVRNVSSVHLGWDADSVLIAETAMRDVQLDSAGMVALRERLMIAAHSVPGVTHASLQISEPFGGMTSWPIFADGVDSVRAFGEFSLNIVSPDYFATMGTRLLRGRSFENGDVAGGTRVMVVGASMGAVLWPGQDPLGKCVRMRADTVPCTYVVGVAEDIHSQSLAAETRLYYYYLPATQVRPGEGGLFVRVRGNAPQLVEQLRKRLQAEMPGSAYITVAPMSANIAEATRSWVMGATVFTAFGIVALLLAGVGLYTVIAYNVAQRKHELAVRMALGARTGAVVRLVLGGGVRLALAGVIVGAIVALLAGRWIEPLLFNQSPRDPAVFATVAVVLLLVAVLASAVPAIRSARLAPQKLLRTDDG